MKILQLKIQWISKPQLLKDIKYKIKLIALELRFRLHKEKLVAQIIIIKIIKFKF